MTRLLSSLAFAAAVLVVAYAAYGWWGVVTFWIGFSVPFSMFLARELQFIGQDLSDLSNQAQGSEKHVPHLKE